MDVAEWEPRRVAAVAVALPDGVTPAGTRGKILEAALALYAELGFYGTSIRRIADQVGINSATLYSHYPSKEHVLAELVRVGHRELHGRLTTAVEAVPPADGATGQLAALVRAHVGVHVDYPLLAVVTNSELHALSPEHAAPSLELRAACRRLLLGILERGVKDGEFAVPDLVLTATAIGAIGMHVAQWFGPDQPFSGEWIAETYVRLALRMAGAAGMADAAGR
ncbi:TetR/AcrR family transcriptional regulator [Streptomyces sp. NPDC048623]|uniref:TetR/AcrR family transcriptional regulator n=1 Tax=Streptomyces sp. NPDC048623 TaxID=3155761 RepID=UPI00343EC75D